MLHKDDAPGRQDGIRGSSAVGGRWLGALFLAAVLVGSSLPAGAQKGPDYRGGTKRVIDLVVRQDFEQAHAYFSDELGKALSAKDLGKVWQAVQEQLGTFQGLGEPTVTVQDKYHVVEVPADFKWKTGVFRVVWDDEGAIAGLRILPSEGTSGRTPATPSSSPAAAEGPAAPPKAQGNPALQPAQYDDPPRDDPMFSGHWEGGIELPSTPMTIKVDLTFRDRAWSGTVDIPMQQAFGIPLSSIQVGLEDITFALPNIPGTPIFQGKLLEGVIRGSFRQGGMTFPFHLGREKVAGPARPQEPKPPFPYREETVSYTNGDVKIEGTLTLPEGDGPFPAALLISGSGAQNRDEEIFGHKPFLYLADQLTRAGIAILRTDDRGVGGSTGDLSKASLDDLAGDALAGLNTLRARKEIDPARVGLIGHSEGGMLAPLVASRSKDVAFVVMLAGPGVPGGELLTRQLEMIYRAGGMKEELMRPILEEHRKLTALLVSDADSSRIRPQLTALADLQITGNAGEGNVTAEQRAALLATAVHQGMAQLLTPWFRSFVRYDPRPALREVRCPVLVLNGDLDLQVDPEQNVPEVQKALEEGGNKDVTVKRLPGLNHLLQEATTGSPEEYAKIEQTMSPVVPETIREWILARFSGK